MKQELLAPSSLPVNSQFFLPRTNGRIAFSARLLSGVISAQFINSLNLSHLFNAYETASPNLLEKRQCISFSFLDLAGLKVLVLSITQNEYNNRISFIIMGKALKFHKLKLFCKYAKKLKPISIKQKFMRYFPHLYYWQFIIRH